MQPRLQYAIIVRQAQDCTQTLPMPKYALIVRHACTETLPVTLCLNWNTTTHIMPEQVTLCLNSYSQMQPRPLYDNWGLIQIQHRPLHASIVRQAPAQMLWAGAGDTGHSMPQLSGRFVLKHYPGHCLPLLSGRLVLKHYPSHSMPQLPVGSYSIAT